MWWRKEPLSPEDQALLGAVLRAHERSAMGRGNASALVAKIVAGGSRNYQQTLIGAIATAGGAHGPVVEAYEVLANDDPAAKARWLLDRGRIVPGWGNSFEKGHRDRLWTEVEAQLRPLPVWKRVDEVQAVLDAKGIFPNPSCYTAATAIHLEFPREAALWFAIQGRLAAWTMIFLGEVKE